MRLNEFEAEHEYWPSRTFSYGEVKRSVLTMKSFNPS